MVQPPTKVCGGCKQEKPTSEFYPIAGGFHSECKACSRARYNEWRRKNREKHAKRNIEWFKANRQTVLARQRDYCKRLGELRKIRRRDEHYKNVEGNRARASAWNKANPDKRIIQRHRREARKRSLPQEWTLAEMKAASAHWGGCCPVCGVALTGHRHWDHWVPLVCPTCPGTVAANMVPLCSRCNLRKNDAMPDDWLRRMFPTTWREIKARVEGYLSSLKT